ncbi:hypothetical protein MVEN_00814300 [Mycena venus]|uniref:Mid2 domain-containing protein n=1 Tax=Mycena venus TaxID=2733690 RepID=A0A8H7D358_9AGAR|nr:hypothetical protein MVEN_00814300 [Mycena venus]
MSPQSSSSNGGGGRNGSNGGGFNPPPPPPFTLSSSRPSQFFSGVTSSATSTFSSSSSSASTSTADTTTITGLLSATDGPQASAVSTTSQKNLPLGLIIGASVGGMILGALIVTLLFYWRRRRAQRQARRSQALLVGFDNNKDLAEKGFLITPFPPPATPTPPTNAKVVDWMRRNAHDRAVSVSTISSFSSPTVIESVGERSSISAYSQLSALRSTAGDNPTKPEGGSNRPPPGLYSINE